MRSTATPGLLLLTAVMLCTSRVQAQPGTLDLSFGTNGEALFDAGSGYDWMNDLVIQPDDKIVVVGSIGAIGGGAFQDAIIVRFNADGTPDTDFGTNGQVTWTGTGGNDRLAAVAIDAQGRIVAAGETQVTGGETQMFALRLLADGSFDTSYSGDGVATRAGSSFNDGSYARDVVCMDDGGIMVLGYEHYTLTQPNYNAVSFWKTTASGGIDPNVGGGSSATFSDLFDDDLSDVGNSMAIRADGKFVVGTVSGNAPNQRMGYGTFGANGSHLTADFENTYDLTTGNDAANSIVLMPDQRCVLAGPSGTHAALVGIMPNASGDLSFGDQGEVIVQVGSSSTSLYQAIRQPWDKVLITGGFNPGNGMYLGRYNADGTPDVSFGTNGFATHQPGGGFGDGRAIGLQSDGRIIVGGVRYLSGSNYDLFLVRFDNDIATALPTEEPSSFSASPNPTNGQITLSFATSGAHALLLCDAQGRLLRSELKSGPSAMLDLHELPAGLYLLREAGGAAAVRVVKE
ncbi:MAG: T9SS type A sorting domain-containing protein [Flavobacteriales bacterium]|nr:T9SS type A sorting domain-containing protein [Flavobacteriales bacterium]